MCKTTTPPRPAALDAVRSLPPNSAAAAVIPLKSYLDRSCSNSKTNWCLHPSQRCPTTLTRNTYRTRRVLDTSTSRQRSKPVFRGVYDDDTDFSASLVKVAALFAAGQLLSAAKAATPERTVAELRRGAESRSSCQRRPADKECDLPKQAIPSACRQKTSSILNLAGLGGTGGPACPSPAPSMPTSMR